MQGFSSTTLAPVTEGATTRDFQKFDAYLDSTGLLLWHGDQGQNTTQTLDLQPPQQDVRNNPNEIPSALGRFFSQADFSHGAGQGYFHKQNSDPASYLYSEGFDISQPGLLKHLNAVNLNGTALTGGKMAQAGDALYVADGTNVRRYTSASGTPTTENPNLAEGAQAVRDITSEGDRIFAALGPNGIHVRDAGTWSHYNDAQAILIAFVRDRIIAASATNLYEITTSGAAPASLLTLKAGWTYTSIGENGQYIYVTAVNEAAGLSVVHHFGLDSTLALQHKGTTPLPDNDLAYSFKGYLGIVFIGCGRKNKDGGKDALLYKATPEGEGFLSYSLVQDSKGAGTRDLSVKSIATYGRRVLFGWTLGSAYDYGLREGIAVYDPALNAFTNHLSSTRETSTPDPVLGISIFKGVICFTTVDGFYYEDTTKKVASAFLLSSTATWGNAGLKEWDQSDISFKKLPATSSIEFQYSTRHPEEGEWSIAGTAAVADSVNASFRHQNVTSQRLTVKFVSYATQAQTLAPEIESFSVRSNPTLPKDGTEYRLVRTVRVFDPDRGGARYEAVRRSPRTVRDVIRGKHLDWVTWAESDDTYTVRLVTIRELDLHTITDRDADPYEEGYVISLVLEGTRNS